MKLKMKKILAGAFAFLLIVMLLSSANALVGNPFSKMLVNQSVEKYVMTHYADLDLKANKASYNFKNGKYYVFLQSGNSMDTYFSVYADSLGRVVDDDYEGSVEKPFNTWVRINDEFSDTVETILKQETDFNYDMILCDLGAKSTEDDIYGFLTLDMDLDLHNPPLPAQITAYIYTEDLTWENMSNIALELNSVMKKRDIPIESYYLVLQPGSAIDEKSQDTWDKTLSLPSFPTALLESENLPEVMKQFSIEALAKMDQEKNLEKIDSN